MELYNCCLQNTLFKSRCQDNNDDGRTSYERCGDSQQSHSGHPGLELDNLLDVQQKRAKSPLRERARRCNVEEFNTQRIPLHIQPVNEYILQTPIA